MTRQAPTTNTAGNPFLTRIYAVETVDDCKRLYDDWSDTYDADLTGPQQNYVAPALIAKAVHAAGGNLEGDIFDAGCGTGLSGKALVNVGAKTIDGVDVSPGMLKFAEKTGIYRHLATADLTKEIPDKGDASYDIVTCIGTLTHGHVGPTPALREFVRVVKSGGITAATVLDDLWESGGYETEVKRLENDRLVDIVSTEKDDYRKAAGVKARILVLRKR